MRSQEPESHATEMRWLLRPRWGAVAAYLVALALSYGGFVQPMSAAPILWAAGITVITNLLLHPVQRPRNMAGLTALLLMFDVALLTWVLYEEGGASNPLSALYLVPIALAAVILPGRWAYFLAGTTITAFGLLFFAPSLEVGAEAMHDGHGHGHGHGERAEGHDFGSHLRGMWVAYALTAMSVAYFITTVSRSLREREDELGRARTRAMRAERVAGMVGLAASTAHELGTPLASITLAAGEMERNLRKAAPEDALADALRPDIGLVQQEARRCRDILHTMLTEAGDTIGESPVAVEAAEIAEAAVGRLSQDERERVAVRVADAIPTLYLPPRLVAQALQNLLRNGLEASTYGTRVELAMEARDGRLHVAITDHGRGMTPAELAEALEPFATTKTGAGHGIGLFFTSTVAERLGGHLQLDSTEGSGTVAHFVVVLDAQTLQ